MLIKCRTKSTRVKGLAFHPRLHFLLASMHSGEIQLWDYMNSAMVDVFIGHDGPVRGVDFHTVQPLFVSGGDDTMVVVWDFRQKKKLFKLTGHLDYIRTVQFHEKYPWIISASDDQTVRIWNWQSRSCISALTGHNHYVMSALFHHEKDLVISASLDHTARIWDISCLCEKTCSVKGLSGVDDVLSSVQLFSGPRSKQDFPLQMDVMSFTDVICKYTLTGHSKGVNWAIFHREAPIAITASDDKTVRAWRYNNDTIWQTNILRSHQNNVCSLIFHPNNVTYLLSVSEDHSIKVWDTTKWALSHTFMMDEDRFWIISKSMNSNYIAAGHDSGLIVFKLFRERPIATIVDDTLYYAWNDTIYMHSLEKECTDYENELKNPSVRPNYTTSRHHTPSGDGFPSIPRDNCEYYLVDDDDMPLNGDLVFPSPSGDYCKVRIPVACISGTFDSDALAHNFINKILDIPNSLKHAKSAIVPNSIHYNHYNDGFSILVVYTNKSQTALDIINKIPVKGSLEYKIISKTIPAISGCFASKNTVVTVDPENRAHAFNLIGELLFNIELNHPVNKVFPVCLNLSLFWSQKDSKLILFNVGEKVSSVISVPFGKISNVLVSRSRQLIAVIFHKFIIIYDRDFKRITHTASNSKIKSAAWDNNFSIIYSTSTQIHYLLLNGTSGIIRSIPNPLYILKVHKRNMYIMGRNHRCFRERINSNDYNLKASIYNNDITVANKLLESGKLYSRSIISHLIHNDQPELARKVVNGHKPKFEISLKFGNLQDALEDSHKIDDPVVWRRLGDAALEQGNCTIAELAYQRGKEYGKLSFLYLITGNVSKLKKMLNISKFRNDHLSTIKHSLYLGDMEELANVLNENGQVDMANLCRSTYGLDDANANDKHSHYLVPPIPINRYDGDELNWPLEESTAVKMKMINYDDVVDEPEDLGAGPDLLSYDPKPKKQLDVWDSIGDDELLIPEKKLDIDLIATIKEGNFIEALEVLKHIYGPVDGTVLNPVLTKIHKSNDALDSIDVVLKSLENGYNHVTNGNFEAAKSDFRTTLCYCMVLAQKYPDGMLEYINQCRVYILAVMLESERCVCADVDVKRGLELAAYFTCCNMKVSHRYLALRRAVGILWKAQNYNTAALLVTRLLKLDVEGAQEEMDKARRIYTLCEQKGTEAYKIDFEPADDCDLKLCTMSFVKIRTEDTVKCKFCHAIALNKYYGQSCNICQLCKLT